MVRDPALEALRYLRTADYTCPAIRYVICILFILQQFYFKRIISHVSYIFWNGKFLFHFGIHKVDSCILYDFTS
jgi:hypothetical protein